MEQKGWPDGSAESAYEISPDTLARLLEQIPSPKPDLTAVLERGASLRVRKLRIYSVVGVAALVAAIGLTSWIDLSNPFSDRPTGNGEIKVIGTPQQTQVGYPSPTFDAPDGWYTDQSDTLPFDTTDLPTAWLSTHSFSQPEYKNLYEELAELPPDGIAIQAIIWGAENYPEAPNVNFLSGELPLDLDDAAILKMWEGQIENVPQYRILVNIDGQALEAQVYFGRLNPTDDQYQAAADALKTLRMPDRN